MKQFTFLLVGAMALFFCVAANKAPVKSLLLDGEGNWLIVKNQVIQSTQQMSKGDIARIAKIAQGIDETNAAHTKVHEDAVNQTLWSHKTDFTATESGREMLAIIAKYKPQETKAGIMVIDNAVVQASKALTQSDFKRLQGISRENKRAHTLVDKDLYVDFIDEKLYTSSLKERSPEVRAQFAKVMNRYVR